MVIAIASQFVSPGLIYSVPYHHINRSEILLTIALLIKLYVTPLYPQCQSGILVFYSQASVVPFSSSFPTEKSFPLGSRSWTVQSLPLSLLFPSLFSSPGARCSPSLTLLFNLSLKVLFSHLDSSGQSCLPQLSLLPTSGFYSPYHPETFLQMLYELITHGSRIWLYRFSYLSPQQNW